MCECQHVKQLYQRGYRWALRLSTPTCQLRLVHRNYVSRRGPSERLALSDILFGKDLTGSAETQAKSAMLIGGLYISQKEPWKRLEMRDPELFNSLPTERKTSAFLRRILRSIRSITSLALQQLTLRGRSGG